MGSGVKSGTHFATAFFGKKQGKQNEQTLYDLSYFKRAEWKNQRFFHGNSKQSADGQNDTPSVFETSSYLQASAPVEFQLEDVQRIGKSGLRLVYSVPQETKG